MLEDWTVIGFWEEGNEFKVAGVVRGDHHVFGGYNVSPYGPDFVNVQAETAQDAERLAHEWAETS